MKEKIKSFFNALDKNNMHLVDEFYDSQMKFEDPLGKHEGVKAMKEYYEKLYKNVTEIRFDFGNIVQDGQSYFAPWTMHFSAKGLAGGKLISVEGGSLIKFSTQSGKAIYHRDYFDMGAFIYEHIPVVKSAIGFIKKKLK